ncbi:hypothetical protein LTR23_011288, partial [Exophiala sp. CCFEE 6169]
MSKMRYCTDLSAQTAEARRQLGLPAESPICPLKGNMLDRTKYRVPGLHWPYGYVSGDDGSLFVIHREDARKDGYLVENEVKRGKCEQKVRHASRWIPRSKLRAMGASFVTLVQRAREVVGYGATATIKVEPLAPPLPKPWTMAALVGASKVI